MEQDTRYLLVDFLSRIKKSVDTVPGNIQNIYQE